MFLQEPLDFEPLSLLYHAPNWNLFYAIILVNKPFFFIDAIIFTSKPTLRQNKHALKWLDTYISVSSSEDSF